MLFDMSQRAQVWIGVVLVLLVVGIATAFTLTVGEGYRDATVAAACAATSCSGSGMAVAGWLLPMTPVLYCSAVYAWFRRSPAVGRVAWIIAGALLFVAAIPFLPGKNGPALAELLDGPGSTAFGGGMRWGLGALGAAVGLLVLSGIISDRVKIRAWAVAAALAACAAATLVGAITRAEPGYLMTTQIFPETSLRVQDDVLTRISATDLDGCGDRHPGCLRTAEFEFTTSDSDAVVRFEIISFPSNDRAWDAWGEAREETGDPATLRVNQVTGEWMTVATVRHADGRAIAPGEEKWLRWPAAQLDYAFRRAIDYSLLYPPEPTETVGPRTP
ncbi:hypothetical protein Aau02nite_69760 [Amorphoplanes auranticolor]|uniref:Uncharacterized protein n=1 Tax=Actinoplanes auranticolor TaxID=47988 RepID=A0A919SPL0_9ACTN|nr:hypothetical protein Aau02nite_69760 [Actinoplanes auranticolor]